MDCKRACEIIDSVVYKPGWSFWAVPCDRFENSITLRISYTAPDFSRENAPEYAKTTTASGMFAFLIYDGMTEAELLRIVFDNAIMSVEQHEAREAFRVAPDLDAPFHPHTQRGMKAFGSTNADLMFGVA